MRKHQSTAQSRRRLRAARPHLVERGNDLGERRPLCGRRVPAPLGQLLPLLRHRLVEGGPSTPEHLLGHLERLKLLERRLARGQFVHQHAEAVDISHLGVALRLEDLRCDPRDGADILGHVVRHQARSAVVCQLEREVLGDEHVEALEVPMDNAVSVEELHGGGHHDRHVHALLPRKLLRRWLPEDIVETSPPCELQHQRTVALPRLRDVSSEHRHQQRVFQQRHERQFPLELPDVYSVVEHLDGNVLAAELAVVDGGRATGAKAAANLDFFHRSSALEGYVSLLDAVEECR
mmetsp:Transcript_28/g.97  ORF Transcript_28/g.97 Transcript_28/m.97 type:complete len:292 (-) Transcript_28:1797-2672(-)